MSMTTSPADQPAARERELHRRHIERLVELRDDQWRAVHDERFGTTREKLECYEALVYALKALGHAL